MNHHVNNAPGWPGISPKWTSSAKCGVGTALSPESRVWFTLSHGILNEIYYPRIDHACTRDAGFIVTDGREFFAEEKRHSDHVIEYIAEGIPAYRLINTCQRGRYLIEKEIITSPNRDALLQFTSFRALKGTLQDYHLYLLVAPHLGNRGNGNTAYVGEYKNNPMLFAERDGYALAVACSAPWLKRSVGFVGISDGWQDLSKHKQMTSNYLRAENGNVALTSEVDLGESNGSFVLALGFGSNVAEAAHSALASVTEDFENLLAAYVKDWQAWHSSLTLPKNLEATERKFFQTSMSVLRTHEAKRFLGGVIASLSVPWGFAKGDEDLGGYHLVWPRDLAEAASGLLAAGAYEDACRVIRYLQVTQDGDGHWPQNMWIDGTSYWNGVQLDETALPILLVDHARRLGAFDESSADGELIKSWYMVRRAAGFLVRNGPVTQQERWEMDPGYSPFTLGAVIAALLAAADIGDLCEEPEVATYLRETADNWNANLERWIYVTGTDVDRKLGLAGHYVRIAPPDEPEADSPRHGFVPIKCRPPDQAKGPIANIVSPDALALVRFGLRPALDQRILDTIKAVDALLRIETPVGHSWRRYVGDRYGEHTNGSPFDGSGIGRAWPLLTGERGHYEIAARRLCEARKLLKAMEGFANEGGMIPEQVWDTSDIPERGLLSGGPTGSAMPLVWAHAEYVKLSRSLEDGNVFDLPPQPVDRYQKKKIGSPFTVWRFNNKCQVIPKGKTLRLEVLAPARVHWTSNRWVDAEDAVTEHKGLGIHVVDLPTQTLQAGTQIIFTFFWTDTKRWEGVDFMMEIEIEVRASFDAEATSQLPDPQTKAHFLYSS